MRHSARTSQSHPTSAAITCMQLHLSGDFLCGLLSNFNKHLGCVKIVNQENSRNYLLNKMSYQLYRNTTLGNTLQESLDELIQYGQITPQLAFKVLLQFDKCINSALSQRVKARVTFKANKLNTYRFCDNVWTLMLNDVEFREVHEFAKVDKVKIVACDGKNAFISEENEKR